MCVNSGVVKEKLIYTKEDFMAIILVEVELLLLVDASVLFFTFISHA